MNRFDILEAVETDVKEQFDTINKNENCFHGRILRIRYMKKRILAASLAVLALTACAPTTPTPSEEARRCLTDSLNLAPRDKIRRAGVTSYEGGVTRGYVKGDRFEIEWTCTSGTASATDAYSG